MNPNPRYIALEGAYNVRDIGGYPTHDGRQTRWRTLLRADSLHRLTPTAQRQLLDYGLGQVVDLRYSGEVSASPNPFAASEAVRYHNIPLFQPPPANPTAATPPPPPSLDGLYRMILDYFPGQIKGVMENLLTHNGSAALVHCSAGKDRTGVIVALLLDNAGVPHEHIVHDYALTGGYLAPIMDDLRQGRPPTLTVEQYEKMLACEPEYMQITLDYLTVQFGGSSAYLRHIGLSDTQVQSLHDWLVE